MKLLDAAISKKLKAPYREAIETERSVKLSASLLKLKLPAMFETNLNKALDLESGAEGKGFGYLNFKSAQARVALDARIAVIRNQGDPSKLDPMTLKALISLDVLFGVYYGLMGKDAAAYLRKQYPDLFEMFSADAFRFGDGGLDISVQVLARDLATRRLTAASA